MISRRAAWFWVLGVALGLACCRSFSDELPEQGGSSGETSGAAAGAAGDVSAGGSAQAGSTGAVGGSSDGGSSNLSGGGNCAVAGCGGRATVSGGAASGGDAGAPAGDSGAGGEGGAVGGAPNEEVPMLGLQLWLRADKGLTLNGSGVSKWADQSGYHRDATQTTAVDQPRYDAAGFNGKPAVVFDGLDAAGGATSSGNPEPAPDSDWLDLPQIDVNFSAGLSVFAVSERVDPSDACRPIFHTSNGLEIDDIQLAFYQQAILYEVSNQHVVDPKYPVQVGVPVIVGVVHPVSADTRVTMNGLAAGNAAMSLPAPVNRIHAYLGRSPGDCPNFKGPLSELLLYNREVTSLEASKIQSYLQKHWACCG